MVNEDEYQKECACPDGMVLDGLHICIGEFGLSVLSFTCLLKINPLSFYLARSLRFGEDVEICDMVPIFFLSGQFVFG